MSKAKHTPRPWELSPNDPCRVNVATGTFLHPYEPRKAAAGDEMEDDDFHDDWNICQAGGDYYSRPQEEAEANARLIAAAPDLLAVAEYAREFALTVLGEVRDSTSALAWAQQMLAKAEAALGRAGAL